mgnify:CR=1 FL=1
MIKTLAIVMMVSFLVFWLFNSLWDTRWEQKYGNTSRHSDDQYPQAEPWEQSYNKESMNMKQWQDKVFGDEE